MEQVKVENVNSLSALLPSKEIFSNRKEMLKVRKTLNFLDVRKGYCDCPKGYIS